MSVSDYVSPRERKVNAIVDKLFGQISPDLAAIVKADLMSKTESPDCVDNVGECTEILKKQKEDDLIEKTRPLLDAIRDENQKFFTSLGQLTMTYDANGNLHTVTQLPEYSSDR